MSAISRRTFVKGLAAGGAAAGLGRFDLRVWAQASRPQQKLAGTSFDLSIAEAPMNFTGSTKLAQTINGSIPPPLLRWREGDTVTLRVANRLDEDTSIHWHGLVLPADMDGVPGLSFHGIRPNESYTYRFQSNSREPIGITAIRASRNNAACTDQSSSSRCSRIQCGSIASTSSCCRIGPTRIRSVSSAS